MTKIHYGVFKELFWHLGINPKEFEEYSEGRVDGYFPDLPKRRAKVNVKEFARVIWGEDICLQSIPEQKKNWGWFSKQ